MKLTTDDLRNSVIRCASQPCYQRANGFLRSGDPGCQAHRYAEWEIDVHRAEDLITSLAEHGVTARVKAGRPGRDFAGSVDVCLPAADLIRLLETPR